MTLGTIEYVVGSLPLVLRRVVRLAQIQAASGARRRLAELMRLTLVYQRIKVGL